MIHYNTCICVYHGVCFNFNPPVYRLNRIPYYIYLSVGLFNSLKVLVTKDGHVIYVVNLPQAVSVPVHLSLNYTNLDNPSLWTRRVTRAAYVNATMIQHIEVASGVPYDHFSVQIGLASGSVFGPVSPAPGDYGERTYIHHMSIQLACVHVRFYLSKYYMFIHIPYLRGCNYIWCYVVMKTICDWSCKKDAILKFWQN